MVDTKKFLDQEGVQHLWSKVNMQDYPNNEVLIGVINAIDETKANKEDILKSIPFNKIFIGEEEWIGYYNIENADFKFIPGKAYTIIWDDIEYPNLICENWEDEYYGVGDMWGSSNTYPFGISTSTTYENRVMIYVYGEEGPIEHSFYIYPIDKTNVIEFDLFPNGLDITTNITYPSETLFTDIQNALESGMRVQFNYGLDEVDIDLPNGIYTTGGNAKFQLEEWMKDSYIILSSLVSKKNVLYNLRVWIQADKDYYWFETLQLSQNISINGLATEEYVDTSIANLVDSAPETLNTLNELATALQENQDLTTTLNQAIGEKATLEDLNNHINDTEVHITAAERETWNIHTSGFDKIVANGGTVYQGIDHNTTLNLDNDDWLVKTIEDPKQLAEVEILSLSINYDKVYNEIITRLPSAEEASF